MAYFQNILKFSQTLKEIENMYFLLLNIFPINTSKEELKLYNIELKKVTIAERTCFLLKALPNYWNFETNEPGIEYSEELWNEMLSYGFKFIK